MAVFTCIAADADTGGEPQRRVGRRMAIWSHHHEGSLGEPHLDDTVCEEARKLLTAGRNAALSYGYPNRSCGELRRGVPATAADDHFRGDRFVAALAREGNFLRYRTTVCDARPAFATARRLPGTDEVVVAWRHRYLRAEADSCSPTILSSTFPY